MDPLIVVRPAGQLSLDLIVGQKGLAGQINHNHLAGAEFALGDDFTLINRDHSRFGSGYHQIVAGGQITHGAQTVSIQSSPRLLCHQ